MNSYSVEKKKADLISQAPCSTLLESRFFHTDRKLSMVAGVLASPMHKHADYTGVTATLAFAFLAWLSAAGANIALALFSLAFLLAPSAWPVFRCDPMFRLFAVFVIYMAIGAYFAIEEFPDTRKLQIRDASNWRKLFAFLPFAW